MKWRFAHILYLSFMLAILITKRTVCEAEDIILNYGSTDIVGYSTTLKLKGHINFRDNNQNDQSKGSHYVISKNQYFTVKSILQCE